jgi:hypothetical protein
MKGLKTMSSFSETLRAITYNDILPKIVDFINESNVFLNDRLDKATTWNGVAAEVPIFIANSNNGSSFTGLDVFSTSATDNVRQMYFYPTGFNQSIVISGMDKAVNAGKRQAISLLSTKMDEAKTSAAASLSAIVYGLGQGKDFDGLEKMVDDGTNTSEYGGILRADLPQVNANVIDAAGGTLTLALMRQAHSAASIAASGKDTPNRIYTTPAIFDLIDTLVASAIQGNYNIKDAGTGKTTSVITSDAIVFRGIDTQRDNVCPAGTLYMLNENYIEFRQLIGQDLTSISGSTEVSEGNGDEKKAGKLQFRDMMSPVNQYAEIGALILMGNMFCRSPRLQAKITGITSI